MVHLATQHRVCELMGATPLFTFEDAGNDTPQTTKHNAWEKVHGTNRLYDEYLGTDASVHFEQFEVSLKNSRVIFVKVLYLSSEAR